MRNVSLAALLVICGCHDPDPGADLGGSGDAAMGPDLSATPSEFGLDGRPANPSCTAPARPPGAPGSVTLTPAFPMLTFVSPLGMVQKPGDPTRLYVIQQTGAVRTFVNDPGTATASDALVLPESDTPSTLPGSVRVGGSGEGGLLGIAFDPGFATSKRLYLSYTSPGNLGVMGGNNLHSVLSRFTTSDDGLTFNPATEEILLEQYQFADNHNGGNIAFGPDGYLYMGLGDGGGGGDPQETGQDLTTVLGKLLRIDVSPAGAYAIPPTNPFAAATDSRRKEIYASGLRNPWRWSFDRATGQLWLGDVGQNVYEEIDLIEAGGNYGWDDREGLHCFEPMSGCATAGRIDPVVEYNHANGNQSVVGGFVYRGSAIPQLVGHYLFADTYSGRIWTIDFDSTTGAASTRELANAPFLISSFAQLDDGELYVLGLSDGMIYRIDPSGTPAPDTFPKTLSATGCTTAGDARQPASGLIPFDVNAPLWSDGADKRRWLALPDGAQIHVEADGDFTLPIGSVLVKEFSRGGKRLETRLLVRHDDGGWAGYSYEWDDAETEATLLPAGKTKATAGGGTWTYPSRNECLSCHTSAAGRTLGLELGQLNGSVVYASTNRLANQLATLEHIGLFDAALGGAPASLARLPRYDGNDALESRARAYLHANCSQCHRPGGPGRGPADFRFGQATSMLGVCGVDPTEGDLGVAGAKLLQPGSPSSSIISLRMHALDAARMPALGSVVVDATGAKLVDDWISALSACP
jgi:uncharacterized repeat protein (TIGR03806 family)